MVNFEHVFANKIDKGDVIEVYGKVKKKKKELVFDSLVTFVSILDIKCPNKMYLFGSCY